MTLENYIKIAKTMGLMNCDAHIAIQAIDFIIDRYSFKYTEGEVINMDARSLWLGLLPEECIGIHYTYEIFTSFIGDYIQEMESGKNYLEAIHEWFESEWFY